MATSEEPGNRHESYDDEERRENLFARTIKSRKLNCFFSRSEKICADQEAGDHEEHVYPYEAPRTAGIPA